MIKLINKSGGNINLTAPSGSAVSGGYYQPIIDEKGNLNWFPSNTSMPTVEGYNIYNAVKVWGADDNLICESESPFDFDFNQITETIKINLGLELNNFDLSRFDGRNVGACLIVMDEEAKRGFLLNFISMYGQYVCGFQLLDSDKRGSLHYMRKGETYINFTAKTEGWYCGNFNEPETVVTPTEKDIEPFTGIFENAKIVDFGSLQIEAYKQMGIEVENVMDEIINHLVFFYFPEGYYAMPRVIRNQDGGGINIPITEEDEGKFLMVQGGAVALVSIPNITEVIF